MYMLLFLPSSVQYRFNSCSGSCDSYGFVCCYCTVLVRSREYGIRLANHDYTAKHESRSLLFSAVRTAFIYGLKTVDLNDSEPVLCSTRGLVDNSTVAVVNANCIG